jgi:hypothetical protein
VTLPLHPLHQLRSVRILRTSLAFAFLAPSIACLAAEGPTIAISGFGSAALTSTDTADAEFARPLQSEGAGKHWRTGPDSSFGLQATATFNSSLSATVQGLVSNGVRGHYGAELAWAFLKHKIDDSVSVRAGRIRPPIYMVSDFLNVGYANTMMRPPVETYSQIPIHSFEGADVVYQRGFGDTTLTVQFGAGSATPKSGTGIKIKLEPFAALHVQLENGPFTVRAGRVDTEVTQTGDPALEGFIASLPGLGMAQVAKDFGIAGIKTSFTSLGATVDYNNFLVQSEYAVRKAATRLLPDTTSYYALFGYRYGKVTPYYIHANLKQDDARTFAGLPETGPLAPVAAIVNAMVKTGQQSTHTVGMRWDFYKSAAFKVQLDRVTPKDGAGLFLNAKPGLKGPVNVYAAGIDFVF